MSLGFYLQKIHAGIPLAEAEAAAACELLMQQEIGTPAAGAFLMALAQRGETMEELTGMALNLRKRTHALGTATACYDIVSCGTTTSSGATILGASMLMAAAKTPVTKLLSPALRPVAAALGMNATRPAAAVETLDETAFALLDPADYTDLLKNIRAHQESLPIPTAFDRVLPMAHPAPLAAIVIGVSPDRTAVAVAQALRRLRMPRALALATHDGSCPFTHAGKIQLVELTAGRIGQDEVQAADFGLDLPPDAASAANLANADSEKQASWLRALFDGRDSPLKQPVLWAAALGFYVADEAKTIPDAIKLAKKTLGSTNIAGVVGLIIRKTAA